MRLLVVTDYMPPQTHGISVHCDNLVRHLRARGHVVQAKYAGGEAHHEKVGPPVERDAVDLAVVDLDELLLPAARV